MSTIEHAALCEQGPVRENNEDFIAHRVVEDGELRLQKGHLFVIADGVGGSQAGEVASMEASRTLLSTYYESTRKPGRALQEAVTQANLHVYDLSHSHAEYRRMQTTLSALVIIGDEAHLGHIGDSRVYRIRDGEVTQLTRDHSEVGELVRIQLLTPEEARHHPRRNIITRSIGSELMVQADFRVETVAAGDIFMLCTDGLWEPVTEPEMAEVVAKATPAEACRVLVEMAIERGTGDNLSIQVIKVLRVERAAPEPEASGLFQRVLRLLGPKAAEQGKG